MFVMKQSDYAMPRNRAGRKRRFRVNRDRSGKISEHEKVADIKGTVMAYRQKRGVSADDASNILAGFTLGRMRLCALAAARSGLPDHRGISAAQLHAGESWAFLCRRYEALQGIPSANAKSAALEAGGGLSLAPEPDPKMVADTKDKWVRCYNALAEAARTTDERNRRAGAGLMSLTYDVCLRSRDLDSLSPEECGDVRAGLNALARVLG